MPKVHVLLLGLVALGTSISVLAADDISSKLSTACHTDINQYCGDITPGSGRIGACLKSHDDKLSSGCKSQWEEARTEMMGKWKAQTSAFHQACNGDIQKYCKDSMGFNEISSCLSQHNSDLSKTCSSYRASAHEGSAASTG